MRFFGVYILAFITALLGFGSLLPACKTPKQATTTVATADTFNAFTLDKFFAYPVTDRKPLFLDGGNPKGDSLTFQRRIQHWYLLYNTKEYKKIYGALPKFYPGNVTLDEYKLNPPRVPDEYNRIMFGYN